MYCLCGESRIKQIFKVLGNQKLNERVPKFVWNLKLWKFQCCAILDLMDYLIIKQPHGNVYYLRRFKTISFNWIKKNHVHTSRFLYCIVIGNRIEHLCVWIRIFLYDSIPVKWLGQLDFYHFHMSGWSK